MKAIAAIIGAALTLATPVHAEDAAPTKADGSRADIDWNLGFDQLGIDLFNTEKRAEELAAAKTACNAEADAKACTNAALIHASPLQGHYDPALSHAYYRRGCDLGDWNACNEAGKLSAAGKSGKPDDGEAYELFARACDKGLAKACANVAYVRYHGIGTQKDVATARIEWQRSCEEDEILAACHNYAGLLKSGEGGDAPAQPERAAQLYALICEEGYEASCNMTE